MSDITWARRADKLLEDDKIDRAGVNATLAIGKATREVDAKIDYIGKLVRDSIDELASDLRTLLAPSPRWICFEFEDDQQILVNVAAIRKVEQDTPGLISVELDNGDRHRIEASLDDILDQLRASSVIKRERP